MAADLLGRGLTSTDAYDELRELSDDIGNRLAGSPQLDAAIEWGAAKMAADGLRTSTEPIMVPRWIRGEEHVAMTAPFQRPLDVLALGNSLGSGGETLAGEVVVVSSWDELDALGTEGVSGKFVLYDVPFTTYGATVQFRGSGASRGAALGAIGAFVRSVTPVSLGTPHTGALRYAEDQPKIPAAAMTLEDASWIHRLTESGTTVSLEMRMGAHFEDDVPSANVVGELPGREGKEIVVLGCHLDSWDVGQGAQDDGSGCTIVMAAGRLLAELPVPPRRTVRVVLFTNEENGLRGGRGYAEAHADEAIFAAVESDTGSGMPTGFGVDVRAEDGSALDDEATEAQAAALRRFAHLLAPAGADDINPGYSGADIGPTVANGATGLGLRHDLTGYWPVHHTRADTFDKIDPTAMARNTAAMAVMAWILAEHPDPFGTAGD